MTAIRRAQAYVDALAPRVAADPDRPRCHFLPPSRWMNDPNGTIRHDGWYHLFYQHNPFGDGWGFMHWGHARSRDLMHWEHLPIALAPLVEEGEEHCFSGCIALDADGTPRLFYTSVAFAGARPHAQWRASPLDDDLVVWERDRMPALAPTLDPEARDPFVFRWQGRTFLVVGDRQRVALYEAEAGDLDRLVERGTFFAAPPELIAYCECPTILAVGERLLLLLSPYRSVEWRLGSFDGERLSVERNGRLDLHDHFYATNTLEDDQGRTVVLGWIRGFRSDRGWNGCLSFPRLIEPDSRTGICQRPHPAIDTLRNGEPVRWQGTVHGVQVLSEDAGDALDVSATLEGAAVLRLAGIAIAWDGRFLSLGGGAYELAVNGRVDLRILVDRTVVEVFADGGRSVVTRVIYVDRHEAQAEVHGDGCVAHIVLYRLAPCRLLQP